MVTWFMWNLVLVRFEIVLVSVQERYTVSAKYTVGLKVILVTLDGTLA
jgi:hypothetical protein